MPKKNHVSVWKQQVESVSSWGVVCVLNEVESDHLWGAGRGHVLGIRFRGEYRFETTKSWRMEGKGSPGEQKDWGCLSFSSVN